MQAKVHNLMTTCERTHASAGPKFTAIKSTTSFLAGFSCIVLLISAALARILDADFYIHLGASLLVFASVIPKLARFSLPQHVCLLFLLMFFLSLHALATFLATSHLPDISLYSDLFVYISVALAVAVSFFEFDKSFQKGLYAGALFGALVITFAVGWGTLQSGHYTTHYNISYLSVGLAGAILFSVFLAKTYVSASKKSFILNLLATVALIIVVALSFSRGALLSVTFTGLALGAAAGFVPLLQRTSVKKRHLLYAPFLPIAPYFIWQLLPERTVTRIINLVTRVDGAGGANRRLDLWSDHWRIFAESPLLGHGLGFSSSHGYPHNLYIQWAVDFGLIGLALFAVITLYPFLSFIKRPSLHLAHFGMLAPFLIYLTVWTEYFKSHNIMLGQAFFIALALYMTATHYYKKLHCHDL